MRRSSFIIAAWALAAAPAAGADFPAEIFSNASIRDLGPAGDLANDFNGLASRIDSPAWIGYAMPRIPRSSGRQWADDSRCGTYYLEEERMEHRRENQAVLWLGSVRGRPGFEILERLARTSEDAGLRHHVTFGLHVSGISEAVEILIAMARRDGSIRVRRQALFWLAQEAGRRAVREIDRATEEDPDVEVKKFAVFALSQLPPEKGVPLLIRHARTHSHPEVRKKAIFWLGQSGDERALDFFEEILLH